MRYKGIRNYIGILNTWTDRCMKCSNHEAYKCPVVGEIHYCRNPMVGLHMIYDETLEVCDEAKHYKQKPQAEDE